MRGSRKRAVAPHFKMEVLWLVWGGHTRRYLLLALCSKSSPGAWGPDGMLGNEGILDTSLLVLGAGGSFKHFGFCSLSFLFGVWWGFVVAMPSAKLRTYTWLCALGSLLAGSLFGHPKCKGLNPSRIHITQAFPQIYHFPLVHSVLVFFPYSSPPPHLALIFCSSEEGALFTL